MQNKLRQLIMSALKRNAYTTGLPLVVRLRGYDVHISGKLATLKDVQEVVSTVESVSPYLNVITDFIVDEEAQAATH
jgi:hypothetical protein